MSQPCAWCLSLLPRSVLTLGAVCSGAYFCQHAFYACAYGEGWLSHGLPETPHEPPSSEPGTVTDVLWTRVALGRCKDFGHRCVSDRDHAASRAKGLDPKTEDRNFKRDWPEEPPFDMMVCCLSYRHRRFVEFRVVFDIFIE